MTHDSTTCKIRNFLSEDRAQRRQQIKENMVVLFSPVPISVHGKQ